MANKGNYKKALLKATRELGTYEEALDQSLDILAEILTEREAVYKQYRKEGSQPIITFVSDRGSENPKPNPLLRQWNELNASALQYMTAVGLTAAGLKKIQKDALDSGGGLSALDRMLFDLET